MTDGCHLKEFNSCDPRLGRWVYGLLISGDTAAIFVQRVVFSDLQCFLSFLLTQIKFRSRLGRRSRLTHLVVWTEAAVNPEGDASFIL